MELFPCFGKDVLYHFSEYKMCKYLYKCICVLFIVPIVLLGVNEFLLLFFSLFDFESMMLWVWKDITHPCEGRSGFRVKGIVGPIP